MHDMRGVYAVKLYVGSVTLIAYLKPDGSVSPVFANSKGLDSPTLSPSSLKSVFIRIGARNADPLAPIKAAASLMQPIHLAKTQDSNLKVIHTHHTPQTLNPKP